MKLGAESISGLLTFTLLTFSYFIADAKSDYTQANIYKQYTVIQCDSLVKANYTNPNFVILDVRTPTEWNSYHLNGSINHSTGSATFDAQLAALPKHKLYLLHCQSGSRSAGAFTKMKNLGFAEVYEMIGGISAWRNAGFPTTTISEPKLMVVSVKKATIGAINDSTQVTVTNRANGVLSFSNISFIDEHPVQTDFNNLKTLAGAEDYSFFVVHIAGSDDTTHIAIESNGGNININVDHSLSTLVVTQIAAELKLFPNPVADRLYFEAGNQTIEKISITDLTGKLVVTEQIAKNEGNIDVSALGTGIYLARIKTRNEMITRKFVINR